MIFKTLDYLEAFDSRVCVKSSSEWVKLGEEVNFCRQEAHGGSN